MSVSARETGATGLESLLIVDFAAGGNSLSYRTDGWDSPESRMTWGVGPRSGLILPAPWDDRPRLLEFDVNPCRHPPAVAGQVLRIRVNDRRFGSHVLTERTTIRCRLDPIVWQGRASLEIVLDHPGYFVPRRLGMAGDARPLAVACFSVRLFAERPARPGLDLPSLPAAAGPVVLADMQADVEAEPGKTPAVARYRFGAHGSARALTRAGWAPPEPDFQWTDGELAGLELPAAAEPGEAGPVLLLIGFVPFTRPDKPATQDVTLTLGGQVIGQFSAVAPAVFGVPLPDALLAGPGGLQLGLVLPDAARPRDLGHGNDPRRLGLCLRSLAVETLGEGMTGWADRRVDEVEPWAPVATSDRFAATPAADLGRQIEAELGVPPAGLLREFESLGENCEFGLAQRKLDVELLGLFRFGYTPLLGLLAAFDDDFAAAADPATVSIAADRQGEYIIGIARYDIHWHTFVRADQADAAATLAAHAARLGLLRRKFLETLRSGRRIFVLKRARPLTLVEVLPVLQALNRHGSNTLMFVVPGAAPARSGSVELLAPNLLRGHLTGFAPGEDVASVAASDWLRLCANARHLLDARPA